MEVSRNRPSELKFIPLSQLKIGDQNVRSNHPTDDEWREFIESVRKNGVLEPLIVANKDRDGYSVIAGSQRLRALQEIYANSGDKADQLVPCAVTSAAEGAIDQIKVSAIENVQRRDLSPEEWAAVVSKLKDMGQSQTQIAKMLGKSEGWVSMVKAGKPWAQHRKTRKRTREGDRTEIFACPNCGKSLARLGRNHYELVQTTNEVASVSAIAENTRPTPEQEFSQTQSMEETTS